MRRLLQRTDNGLYYQGPGAWTRDPLLALSFDRTAGAIDACAREQLAAMQVVLKFEESSFDVRFPCFLQGGPEAARSRHGSVRRPL
jgi:hypothetical protein